jgi:hypothetical protein
MLDATRSHKTSGKAGDLGFDLIPRGGRKASMHSSSSFEDKISTRLNDSMAYFENAADW